MLKLTAQLMTKDGSRSREPLVTASLDFDADYASVYADRLKEGQEKADQWLKDHAEQIILAKCSITFRLEHSDQK